MRTYQTSVFVCTLLLTVFLIGCGKSAPSGPVSTQTSSPSIPEMADRIAFLEKYVTFRRQYEQLDFSISYTDNAAGVSGPATWDIRLIAIVPASELDAWIAGATPVTTGVDSSWINLVPQTINSSAVKTWFTKGQTVIGIDREHRVVMYRSWN